MSDEINVAVLGASGRMGRNVVEAINAAPGLRLVAELDVDGDLAALSSLDVQVAVDFTTPAVTVDNVLALVGLGIHAVVGTSGWTQADYDRVEAAIARSNDSGNCPGRKVGVLVAPNFALGAVLLMSFAERAAKYFESVEIIELHHPDKLDAPSGTAVHTAERVAAARAASGLSPSPDATAAALPGARGADIGGVRVHSVRLRGLVAHEEVLMGGPGEQFTLRHDSFDRISFMPGVILGVREVGNHPGLSIGLEHYLDLG